MSRVGSVLAAIALGFGSFVARATPVATFTSFLPPAPGDFHVSDVSSDGAVVGWYRPPPYDTYNGYRWTSDDGYQLFPDFPVNAISSDGRTIVGSRDAPFPLPSEPVRWTAAEGVVGLGDQGVAGAVSADGSVIAVNKSNNLRVFRWTADEGLIELGVGTALDISADGSVMVGRGDGAFRWTEAGGMMSLGSLPGGLYPSISSANGVSADGSVAVGYAFNASGRQDAFRWSEATGMVSLGPGSATGVSAQGEIVVGYQYGPSEAANALFIWDPIYGWRNLQRVLVNYYDLDLSGWRLEAGSRVSITDDGHTIAGVGRSPEGQQVGWIVTIPTLIPEPDTALLVALGLAVLSRARRR